MPVRALLGTRDAVVRLPMVSPETANADDYQLETVDATHFVVDERPDLVRKKLIALAEETAHYPRADAKVPLCECVCSREKSLLEAVAHARFGEQVDRVGRVVLELASQLRQIHTQIMRFLGVGRAPHLFE